MRAVSLLAMGFITFPAAGAELRIPIPDLAGIYELSSFEDQPLADPPRERTVLIRTALPISDIRGLRVELTGSIFSGEVVGDGVFREEVAAPFRGSFAPSFMLGDFGLSWLFVAEEPDGPLQSVFEFPGRFDYPFVPEVANFDPLITLSLTPGTFSFTNINYIDVPSEPIVLPDVRGILITTPMRGEISSAFLIVQYVPEPASSVLLLVGGAVLGKTRRWKQNARIMQISSPDEALKLTG
jgi:hypothetical protein